MFIRCQKEKETEKKKNKGYAEKIKIENLKTCLDKMTPPTNMEQEGLSENASSCFHSISSTSALSFSLPK